MKRQFAEMKLSKKISIFLGVTILVLVVWFAVIPKRNLGKKPRNVLFIIVDTLRSDHLGCYGYKKVKTPNIDSLAKQGMLFKNVICQVPLTLPSHCSLFTSTYPQFNNVRDNGSYRLDQSAITLAEIMQENAYTTAAFVSTFVLDSRFGLDQGFETYDDRMQKKTGKRIIELLDEERTAEKVTDAAIKWLRDNKDEKFFLWVHYFDPHTIYNPPSPYREIYKDNLYDGEIAFTDQYIGVLLSALKELKLDKETFMIFASDHGEGLGEHEELDHGVFIYDTTLKVPLIFSYPGLIPEGKVIEEQVRLIDIMPTILDLLHIKKNKEIQGRSLIRLIKGRIKSLNLPAYSESIHAKLRYNWSELKSFRTGEWKYIKSPEAELYNIKDDPGELVNLAGERVEVVKDLDNRLDKFLNKTSSPELKETRMEMDEETKEKLMSLGYIGGSIVSDSEGPVPRKMVQIRKKMSLLGRLANEGLIERAIEGFNEVLKVDPNNTEVHKNIAQCYKGLGKYGEAIRYFKKAASLNPNEALVHSRLGEIYASIGRIDEAFEEFKIALLLDSHNPTTINNIGWCYQQRVQIDKAMEQYKKAIELDPEYAEPYSNRGVAYLRLGDFQEAMKDFDKAIELDPQYAEAYSNRGVAYLRLGDFQEAMKDFDKAIELDPKNAQAYSYRGIAYEDLGNRQRAIEDFDQAIELNPQFAEAYSNRGIAYAAKGQYEEAISDYKKALKIDPDNVRAYNEFGYLYIDKEIDLEEGLKLIKKALALAPENPFVVDSLGWGYYKKGMFDEALEEFERAIGLGGEGAEFHEHLARAYEKKEMYEEAVKAWERVLEIDPQHREAQRSLTQLTPLIHNNR